MTCLSLPRWKEPHLGNAERNPKRVWTITPRRRASECSNCDSDGAYVAGVVKVANCSHLSCTKIKHEWLDGCCLASTGTALNVSGTLFTMIGGAVFHHRGQISSRLNEGTLGQGHRDTKERPQEWQRSQGADDGCVVTKLTRLWRAALALIRIRGRFTMLHGVPVAAVHGCRSTGHTPQ